MPFMPFHLFLLLNLAGGTVVGAGWLRVEG